MNTTVSKQVKSGLNNNIETFRKPLDDVVFSGFSEICNNKNLNYSLNISLLMDTFILKLTVLDATRTKDM